VELPKALQIATEEEQAKAQVAQGPTGMEAMMAEQVAAQTGTPQALPTVGEAGQGLQNLAGLMTSLRKTNTRSAGRAALGGNY
jgi:hypothetical protein